VGCALQDNTVAKQQEEPADEMAAEAGTALPGRRTMEALGGAERIADALELAAAEAERQKVLSLLPNLDASCSCTIQNQFRRSVMRAWRMKLLQETSFLRGPDGHECSPGSRRRM
jgi:hypothetical protein